MKYVKVLSAALLLFIQIRAAAQNVGIGTATPDGSAKLDIVSTGSGLLIPRMTAAQKNAIATPATGLLIYQTNAPAGFYYYDGSQWLPFLNSSSGWNITGNSGTTNGSHFLGTTDAQSLDIRTNNVIRVRITQKGQIEILNTGNSVFVGEGAGAADDLSTNANVFVGYQAGNANTTGYNNIATGYQALYSNTTGYNNIANGFQSLRNNTTGYRNSAIGLQALYNNTTGFGNTAHGYLVMNYNTTGSNNTATGSEALYRNTTGYYNIATGYRALYYNTTGSNNTAIGSYALNLNTTGSANTAYGYGALNSNAGNQNSVAIGYGAMYYADNRTNGRVTYNTAIGYEALRGSTIAANNTGRYNTVTGYQSLYANTTGHNNTAIGRASLTSNTSGYTNSATGSLALYSNTTGNANIATGYGALYNNTTGDNNTAIGSTAGYNSTGSGNVFLGNQAGYNETGSNRLYIDNSNTASPLVWGDFSSNILRINGILQVNNPAGNGYAFPATEGTSGYLLSSNGSGTLAWINPATLSDADWTISGNNQYSAVSGNVGIGTASPSQKLDVVGNIEIPTTTGTGGILYMGSQLYLHSYGSTSNLFLGVGSGNLSLSTNTLYGRNTGIGINTLDALTIGRVNTAIGNDALTSLTTGERNVAMGGYALISNVTGSDNTAIGTNAGRNNTGSGNVFIGSYVGYNETGSNKLYIDNSNTASPLVWGDFSSNFLRINGILQVNDPAGTGYAFPATEGTSGYLLSSNGSGTLTWTNPASLNDADWTVSGNDQYSAVSGNVGIGTASPSQKLDVVGNIEMPVTTTTSGILYAGSQIFLHNYGFNNVFLGRDAGNLTLNTSNLYGENVGVGNYALDALTTGERNTASGYNSLTAVTSGNSNTAFGWGTLDALTVSDYNTAFGYAALPNMTSGTRNVALGHIPMQQKTSGNDNVAIGAFVLDNNLTGNNNVVIGSYAGYTNTGSSNVFIGYYAGYNETGSNRLYIDNSNTTSPLVWGDFSSNILRINGTLQVNDPAATGYAFPAAEGTSGYVLASDGSGTLAWQAVADGSASNELQTITAGNGLTGGGSGLSITLDAVANNGLTANADDIQLGGTLLSTTTLTMGTFNLIHSLDNTGDFIINDGANSVLRVYGDNGTVVWNESGTANTDIRMESDLNTHMFFMDAGNNRIGINESAPQSALHISGNSTASVSQLELDETAANDGARLRFSNSGETINTWLLFGRADNTLTDSKFNLNHTSTGNIIQVIGSGYVGIRQNNATFSLQLPNNVTTGEARANSWTTYSDARIKENIRTLDYGLQAVMALQPRVYTQYASDFENGKLILFKDQKSVNIGFVAQELYEIVPEAAMPPKDENRQLWGVDYTRLIPVLTKAIQEQQEEISRLKKEIEMLKIENRQEIDSLRERMERLEER